jgi:acyl-CoA reductase-like NAD-dependent aldehyde dehydrogenase
MEPIPATEAKGDIPDATDEAPADKWGPTGIASQWAVMTDEEKALAKQAMEAAFAAEAAEEAVRREKRARLLRRHRDNMLAAAEALNAAIRMLAIATDDDLEEAAE